MEGPGLDSGLSRDAIAGRRKKGGRTPLCSHPGAREMGPEGEFGSKLATLIPEAPWDSSPRPAMVSREVPPGLTRIAMRDGEAGSF